MSSANSTGVTIIEVPSTGTFPLSSQQLDSLSLSFTAASSSYEPSISSIIWGGVSSTVPVTSSPSQALSTASQTASSSLSSTLVSSSRSDTLLSPGQSANSSLVSTTSTSQTSEVSVSSSAVTDSRSYSTTMPSSTATPAASSTWSIYTSEAELTQGQSVVQVEITSSRLVAVTQGTTIYLEPTDSATTQSVSNTNTAVPNSLQKSNGTSNATKIACGVAIPIGAIALLGVGFFYLRRRHGAAAKRRVSVATDEDYFDDCGGKHSKHNSINAHHMF